MPCFLICLVRDRAALRRGELSPNHVTGPGLPNALLSSRLARRRGGLKYHGSPANETARIEQPL